MLTLKIGGEVRNRLHRNVCACGTHRRLAYLALVRRMRICSIRRPSLIRRMPAKRDSTTGASSRKPETSLSSVLCPARGRLHIPRPLQGGYEPAGRRHPAGERWVGRKRQQGQLSSSGPRLSIWILPIQLAANMKVAAPTSLPCRLNCPSAATRNRIGIA